MPDFLVPVFVFEQLDEQNPDLEVRLAGQAADAVLPAQAEEVVPDLPIVQIDAKSPLGIRIGAQGAAHGEQQRTEHDAGGKLDAEHGRTSGFSGQGGAARE